jgi:hypothetical protein
MPLHVLQEIASNNGKKAIKICVKKKGPDGGCGILLIHKSLPFQHSTPLSVTLNLPRRLA